MYTELLAQPLPPIKNQGGVSRSTPARLPTVALFVLLGACGDPANPARDGGAEPRVRFEEVEIIFNAACTESGCHGPTRAGGLELHERAWDNLVGVDSRGCSKPRKLVIPFEPRRSHLIEKLVGAELCGGQRMPRGCDDSRARPCLSTARLATIEAWIAQGAGRD